VRNEKEQSEEEDDDDDDDEESEEAEQFGQDLLGQRIKLWWAGNGKWFNGMVVKYDDRTGKHTVDYEDGDSKSYVLKKEKWDKFGRKLPVMSGDVSLELSGTDRSGYVGVKQHQGQGATYFTAELKVQRRTENEQYDSPVEAAVAYAKRPKCSPPAEPQAAQQHPKRGRANETALVPVDMPAAGAGEAPRGLPAPTNLLTSRLDQIDVSKIFDVEQLEELDDRLLDLQVQAKKRRKQLKQPAGEGLHAPD
jgi:hypothetical protein